MSKHSQHKLSRRQCPVCLKIKEFPERNATCGRLCAEKLTKLKLEQARATQDESVNEHHDITGNTWAISIPRTRIHTLEQLLEYCQVDQSIWDVEKFTVTKLEGWRKDKQTDLVWDDGVATGYVKDSGKIFYEQLFNVKAWLRRKTEILSIRAEIDNLKRLAQEQAPTPKPIKRKRGKPSSNMLEISIPDLHLGKLAWSQETGWGDYDIKIAENLYLEALEKLLERANAYIFDEICLVVGNDLMQADNKEGTTASGTPVDTDTRYHKMFGIASAMTIRAIERLRYIAPVRVIVVPGNHDRLSTWHLGHSLECYFHKYTDVTIENSPSPRKYYQWGIVMLMWAHEARNRRLRDDYPLLMAAEQPAMFGASTFREVHLGDIHQVRLEEQHGVRVRVLPSLSSPDEWHSNLGFVGNIPSAECYIWNKQEGLIGMAIYSALP